LYLHIIFVKLGVGVDHIFSTPTPTQSSTPILQHCVKVTNLLFCLQWPMQYKRKYPK